MKSAQPQNSHAARPERPGPGTARKRNAPRNSRVVGCPSHGQHAGHLPEQSQIVTHAVRCHRGLVTITKYGSDPVGVDTANLRRQAASGARRLAASAPPGRATVTDQPQLRDGVVAVRRSCSGVCVFPARSRDRRRHVLAPDIARPPTDDRSWRLRIAVLAHRLPGADESSQDFQVCVPRICHLAPVRVMQGRLTRKCAASLGIPARRACGCYLVSSFVAAGPSLARSSGLVASSTFSANFRWEASSCSVKS